MASSEHLVHADRHKAESAKTNLSLLPFSSKKPRKTSKKKGGGGKAKKQQTLIFTKKDVEEKQAKENDEEEEAEEEEKSKKEEKPSSSTPVEYSSEAPIYLADLIRQQKRKLQGDQGENGNGVTYVVVGSSGCGKSTMIEKIFISDVYADKGKFLITIFTNSSKSDAFKKLDKSVMVCGCGVDEDYIRWCYQMNNEYDKRYNFITMLDDVIDFRHSLLVNQMFLIMRNTNLTSFCSLQYPNHIPPAIRISAYFTFCFSSNNQQGIEMSVRYYLAGYLPGTTIRQKMDAYREWTEGGEGAGRGHRFFLLDNLNHACFRIDENYMCYKMEMLSFANPINDKHHQSSSEYMDEGELDESAFGELL